MFALKGAAQGSLFCPFANNIFSNDLLLLLQNLYTSNNIYKDKILNILNVVISWFTNNGMKANPDKFQTIFFDKCNTYKNECITLGNQILNHQDNVKSLGVYIYLKLNALHFIYYISEIHVCKKAGYKLNVLLARLSKTLGTKDKMLLFHSFPF